MTLPPGRARLSTKPAPTGSVISHEHDRHGAGRLLQRGHGCAPGGHDDVRGKRDQFRRVFARRSPAPAPQRVSIGTLRPSVQPNSCSACRNAAMRACPSGSSAAVFMSTPMRRTRSACCARAASGQATAAPPRSVMNSRRRISPPKVRGQHCIGSDDYCDRGSNRASKPLPQCTRNVSDGSKPECLPNPRISALASYGHASHIGLGR